ncbi:hypothetical protein B7494_g8388 [Chlorociboria aeruginascens]|nr:hypothetical protein B7494_g8388 [Chlorociboria aeruginascens]
MLQLIETPITSLIDRVALDVDCEGAQIANKPPSPPPSPPPLITIITITIITITTTTTTTTTTTILILLAPIPQSLAFTCASSTYLPACCASLSPCVDGSLNGTDCYEAFPTTFPPPKQKRGRRGSGDQGAEIRVADEKGSGEQQAQEDEGEYSCVFQGTTFGVGACCLSDDFEDSQLSCLDIIGL